MSAAAQDDGCRVSPGRGSGRRTAGWFLSLLLALAIAAALVARLPDLSSDRRALRELPEEQRAALLSRTLDDLRQFCGERRNDALSEHCRELASFVARFDECRGECQALVWHELRPDPSR